MTTTLNKAVEIREAILHNKKYNREPSPSPSTVNQEDEEEEPKPEVNYSMQPQLNITQNTITTSSSLHL